MWTFSFKKEEEKVLDTNEVEFDVENLDIISIERTLDKETFFAYHFNGKRYTWYLETSIEKHREFITRFRTKME